MTSFDFLESTQGTSTPKTVVTFSGMGGVGKTTLLTNIAGAIAKHSSYEPSICIFDLNRFYPSVCHMFHPDDIQEEAATIQNMKDVLRCIKEAGGNTASVLRSAFHRHKTLNIYLLANEPNAIMKTDTPLVRAEIEELLHTLKELFDIILIDTSHDIRKDESLVPIVQADKTFLIVNPNISTLVHSKGTLEVIKTIDNHMGTKSFGNTHIILNKYDEKFSVSEETVEQMLCDKPIWKTIEYDADMITKTNNRTFAFEETTDIAASLLGLAKSIYPFDKEEESKVKPMIQTGKEKWAQLHGSQHLQQCISLGYNAQRSYVEERSAHEFPNFVLDFDNISTWKSRSCPSPKAIETELHYRSIYNDEFYIRIVWLTYPVVKTENWKPKEAIIVRHYLGKYTLVQEIDETL